MKKSLFIPDYITERIDRLNADFFRKHSINDVVVDIDNTIVKRDSSIIEPEIRDWLLKITEDNFRLFVVSNNWNDRVSEVMKNINYTGAIAPAGKPFLTRAKKMINTFEIRPQSAVFIGDQIFTDMVFANRLGFLSVLVYPLGEYDLPHTRFLRIIERRMIKSWLKKGQTKTI